MPSDKTFPHERLRRARIMANYQSASEAADAVGVNRSAYTHHENGTRKFHHHAERYARFFRVDLEWLVTGRGEPRSGSFDVRAAALSESDQQELRNYLEYLETRARTRNPERP